MDYEEIKREADKRREEFAKKEKERAESDFEKVKKLLQEKPNGYNKPYILKQLHEKDNLRKTYLAVVKNSPARISEVFEEALLTKPTCYTQLHKLLELHLVSRIFVLDVVNGAVVNEQIKKKFTDWSLSMPEQLKRYYLAKTSFWVITDFGKEFALQAWEFEQEFRQSQKRMNLSETGELIDNGYD